MKKINTVLSFMVTIFLLFPSLIFSCDRGRGNWVISVVNKSDVAVEIKNDYKKKSVVVPAGQTISLSDFMIPWGSYNEKMQITVKTQDKGFSENIVYQLNERCLGSRSLNVFEINKQIPIMDGKEYALTISATYDLVVGEGVLGVPVVATISPVDFIPSYMNVIPKLLTYAGVNINAQNSEQLTPLHVAVVANNLEAVKALLALQPSLTLKDKNGQTPVDLAVMHSLVSIAQELLHAGAPTTYKDSQGSTLLHTAVGNKQLELVKSLLAAGADMNVQNMNGTTPLHLAVAANNLETVKALLKLGPSLTLKDKNGQTPLDIAVMHSLVPIAQELLRAGAPTTYKDSQGNTLLHTAVGNKQIELVKSLLAAGADVNAQNMNGTTPLVLAVFGSVSEIAKELLNAGALITYKDSEDNTLLHTAVGNKQLDLARLLLEKGINVDAQNKGGTTPLHLAIVTNNYDMVNLLLSFNPALTLKDSNLQTPLELALSQANGPISVAITESLIKRGLITPETQSSYTYALFLAIKNNIGKVVKILIEAGVPMTDRDIALYRTFAAGVATKVQDTAPVPQNSSGGYTYISPLGYKYIEEEQKRKERHEPVTAAIAGFFGFKP